MCGMQQTVKMNLSTRTTTRSRFIPWHGHLMARESPHQVMVELYRYGMQPPLTMYTYILATELVVTMGERTLLPGRPWEAYRLIR